jgi:hypothetical protein
MPIVCRRGEQVGVGKRCGTFRKTGLGQWRGGEWACASGHGHRSLNQGMGMDGGVAAGGRVFVVEREQS